MAEVRGETRAGRGGAFECLEGALCVGQPSGEIGVGGERWGKLVR